MSSSLQKSYLFNPEIVLKEKENSKILAVSIDENDHNYYEFTDLAKDCLKMFSEGKETADILKMVQQKAKGVSKQESIDFLTKFTQDLIQFQIIK